MHFSFGKFMYRSESAYVSLPNTRKQACPQFGHIVAKTVGS